MVLKGAVQMNSVSNETLNFDGIETIKTVRVNFLEGENVVTLFQVDGEPWVDAFVVD